MAPWNLSPAPDPDPDPLTVVDGLNGSTYPCPDIPTLDAHLAALSDRLRHAAPRFPHLVRSFRKDIDRLLDRRLWLELETGLATKAEVA